MKGGKCPLEPPTKKADEMEVMSRRKLGGRHSPVLMVETYR